MEIFIRIMTFIVGAVFGSFYLVIGKRLPKEEDVVKTRSRCDHCKHPLAWWELIPIVSFIILGGKCSKCKKRIDPLHFIIEIVTGGLFLFSYLHYGFGYSMFVFDIVSSLLLLIFITDFSYFIILDSPLIASAILLIILKFIYLPWQNALLDIAGGIGLFGVMYLIGFFGDKAFKRESLGGGDIKLAGIMGLTVGFKLGLVSLVLSTFLALPYSMAYLMLKKNNEVPFGPFLISSLFVVFLFIEKFESLLNLIFASL